MTEPIFGLPSLRSPLVSRTEKNGFYMGDAESVLSQQLQRGLEHLEQHLLLLPAPYPGCILCFTVAATDQAASVFHVRATTLEAAWREGATRVRQWAWARKLDALELRIDWVQSVISLKAAAPWHGAMCRDQSWALADAELEHIELVFQHLQSPADGPRQPASPTRSAAASQALSAPRPPGGFSLLLSLQGVYIRERDAGMAVPRTAHLPEYLSHCAFAQRLPMRATLQALLHAQHAEGRWPGCSTLAEHLCLTYALLVIQRSLEHPAISGAIERAVAYATARLHLLPPDGMQQALALLVLLRHASVRLPHDRLEPALIQALEQLAQTLRLTLDTSQMDTAVWARQALNAFAYWGMQAEASAMQNPSADAASVEQGPVHRLMEPFLRSLQPMETDVHGTWLAVVMLESALQDLPLKPPLKVTQRRWHAGLQQLLQTLSERMLMPEHALYLSPKSRQRAAFFKADSWHITDARTAAQLLITGQAAFELLHTQDVSTSPGLARAAWSDAAHTSASTVQTATAVSAVSRAQALTMPAAPHGVQELQAHAPMAWSSDALARTMNGVWVNHPSSQPANLRCAGLDVSRQHHAPGAAVLVRRAGMSMGVTPAALHTLRASAFISSSPQGLTRHGIPILHVPDIRQGMAQLAQAARARIKVPVIASTGCTGKSSTLSMLRRCLLGQEDARADALLGQSTSIQMINWSETAPFVLVEIPPAALQDELAVIRPDILIVTNEYKNNGADNELENQEGAGMAHMHSGAHEISKYIHLMQDNAILIVEHTSIKDVQLIAAVRAAHIRVVTFGMDPASRICGATFVGQKLHASLNGKGLELELLADGHHMAMNALAVLATLAALGKPAVDIKPHLERWLPLAGTGQPQRLANGICLLDHSQSSHMLSMRAALAHLHAHAACSHNRVIVLAGIQAQNPEDLEAVQLALEPLIRSTSAKQVLLYGDALQQLGNELNDLAHVSWYNDLNQLVDDLLRSAQKGDTVLLAGRATTNLAIVADALRESDQESAGLSGR